MFFGIHSTLHFTPKVSFLGSDLKTGKDDIILYAKSNKEILFGNISNQQLPGENGGTQKI